MNMIFSSFDTLVRFDRMIIEAEEEIVLLLPFLTIPEVIRDQLEAASRRGVRIILIHGQYSKDVSAYREIDRIQIFSIRHLHAKMILTDQALMTFSSNLTSTNQSEIAMYLESNDKEFPKITKVTKDFLAKAMIESPVASKKPTETINQQGTIGMMLKQTLENQKDEIKDQIIAEMSVLMQRAMQDILVKVSEVKDEVKVNQEILIDTNNVVIKNYELTNQIRSELLDVLPAIQKKLTVLRTDLHTKFQDLEHVYDEISEKIIEEIQTIQVKIDRHNYEKAEQYLSNFLGDCWNIINLESQSFLITSEVIYHVMKDQQELDFSPVMIPMTKALENILNHFLFKRVVDNLTENDIHDTTKFKNIRIKHGRNAGQILHHVTIGDIIYMFKDRDVVSVINRNHLFKQDVISDPYFSRDDRFRNGEINLTPQTFIGKLNLIRDKYRNKVAHKDGISRTTAEECRQFMIFGEAFIKELMERLNIE